MKSNWFMTLWIILLCFVSTTQASPKIEHWQTSNGVRVYFVAAPEIPMLDIEVIFDAGAARDWTKPGLASFTNAMMDSGAAGMDTDELAERFESLGAHFGSSSQRDMASLSLRSLTDSKQLELALATFKSVLTQPDFPLSEFKRIKKQKLIGLQAQKQSPSSMASRAFYTQLYGDHPYGILPSGTEQSVTTIALADIKAFYQRYYVAKNAVVVMVGDIDRTQAENIAAQLLADLPSGQAAPDILPVKMLKKAENQHIDFPASQTQIVMGQPAISRDDPDYFPLYVGNHILGGNGLVSRLSQEIREKRGLTYSVYSYFRPMRQLGPFTMGLKTKNDQTEQALELMRETLNTFINQGPTEQELQAAKQNITGGFPLRIDSNSKIIGYLAMLAFYALPLDYLDTFNQKVDAVTLEQIKSAFQRRIDVDNMVTITVGGATEQ